MTYARYALVVILLFFSWKGVDLDLSWPPSDQKVASPTPSPQHLEWTKGVRPIAEKMLPSDRLYMASLYEAMAFVLLRDEARDKPIIATTDDFVTFHSGSLRLSIDKQSVGKYPGLAEAIDSSFMEAVGADQRSLDKDSRGRLVAACGSLAWTFGIGRDE